MPECKHARRLLPDPDNEPDFYNISSMFPVPDEQNKTTAGLSARSTPFASSSRLASEALLPDTDMNHPVRPSKMARTVASPYGLEPNSVFGLMQQQQPTDMTSAAALVASARRQEIIAMQQQQQQLQLVSQLQQQQQPALVQQQIRIGGQPQQQQQQQQPRAEQLLAALASLLAASGSAAQPNGDLNPAAFHQY
jgi:hypothetical protein